MTNFSEESIRSNCPHCGDSIHLKHKLKTTENFMLVCDLHPLTRGHILLIPKKHLACVGEYPVSIIDEFLDLYNQTKLFIKEVYGSVSTFEHGITGQTVFHSHIQMFPYSGPVEEVISEGSKLTPISDITELKDIYKRDEKYMFFSIGQDNWIVDTSIGCPGFFRYRFGKAMGNEVRANWKNIHFDEKIMKEGQMEIEELVNAWNQYSQ